MDVVGALFEKASWAIMAIEDPKLDLKSQYQAGVSIVVHLNDMAFRSIQYYIFAVGLCLLLLYQMKISNGAR